MTELISQTLSVITSVVLAISSLAGVSPQTQLAQVVAPTSGLVSHWNFDEGSGSSVADSVGSNNGSTSNTSWVTGKLNGGLSFNGSSSYVSFPSFNIAGSALTITAWVKLNALDISSDYRFVSKATTWSEQDHNWMLGTTNSGGTKLRARLKAGGSTQTLVASSGNLSVGTWHHAVLRYDGSTMKLYLDGSEVGSVNKTGNLDSSTALVNFGRNPGTPDTGYLNGVLDEVRIYNRALSVSEIQDIINDTGTPASLSAPQITSFTSSPSSITSGQSSTLSWNVSGNPAPTLSITPGNPSTSSGSVSVAPTQTTTYTLTATNSEGSTNAQTTVTVSANPTPTQYTLSVSKGGTGSGTVSGTLAGGGQAGISCGSDCSETVNSGTAITLSASPSSGSTFTGWTGGGCSGTGSCIVTLNSNTSVTATFNTTQTPPPTQSTYYIRDGGTSSSCTDWANACDSLPATLQRGATYYIADGTYGGYTFDDPNSGTQIITIKKATASDHGTNTGWQSAYGDGQAVFGSFNLVTDYFVVDGQTRNENNWNDGASYGFRASDFYSHSLNFGHCTDNLTVRYVDVGGPDSDTFNSSIPSSAFYFGGFGETCDNWTISRNRIHNVYLVGQMAGADNIIWEYNWMGPNWSKETLRGQIRASNITIRHNIMKDGCQGTPGDPTAGGCTGQIAMWDGDSLGDFDNNKIYGNLIWTTKGTHHSDAVILIGGDGNITAAGVTGRNNLIYNNTIVGIQSGQATIRFNGTGGGNVAQNNIWYGLGSTVNTGCGANTCTNNVVIPSSSQFVNASGGNFRLAQATQNGTTLSSPYNTDMDGKTRGSDGTWDLGAYEFTGTATPPPPPPPTSTTFSPNDRIQVNVGVGSNLNVRSTPTTSATPVGTQPNGALGTVVSGGQYVDGYFWWNINYDSGVDGWSVEDFLQDYTTPPPPPVPIVGDLNSDGLVNSIDLSLLTSKWLQVYAPYDLNNDGIVSSLDYAVMVQNWSL